MATIPSDDDYDLSVRAGPRTAWTLSVSTRKALTSVCKAWYGAASEALYADIALRRMGQINALARTLRSSRAVYAPDPSAFIKRIRIAGCTVSSRCARVARADLTYILESSSRLKTFEDRPDPLLETLREDPLDVEKWYNPVWFWDHLQGTPGGALAERCASGLQHLAFAELRDEEHLIYIHHLLLVETHLATVTLGPLWIEAPTVLPTLSQQTPISLPHLTDLQIPSALLNVEQYTSDIWHLPNLRQLTVLSCHEIPRNALDLFGKRLKYLHVVPEPDWKGEFSEGPLSMLRTLCPVLEHLVLPHIATLNLPCVIASPTLQYLDIWGSAHKRRVVELMCEMGRACSLPSLRAIRMLTPCNPYPDDSVETRLPLFCDPADVTGDAVRMRTLPWGVRVLQTSWAILRDLGGRDGDDIRFYNVPFDEEVDSEAGGGSDYEPSWAGEEAEGDEVGGAVEDDWEAEDEGDGTSWVSDSDSEASVGEDEDGPGPELVAAGIQDFDRETVLEMFARSQEGDHLLDDEPSL